MTTRKVTTALMVHSVLPRSSKVLIDRMNCSKTRMEKAKRR